MDFTEYCYDVSESENKTSLAIFPPGFKVDIAHVCMLLHLLRTVRYSYSLHFIYKYFKYRHS